MQPLPNSIFLRRAKAAAYVRARWGIPCSPKTLAKLAVIGGGPIYRLVGRYPVYAEGDLDSWVQSKLSAPMTSTQQYRK